MIHTLGRDAFLEMAMTQTDAFMRSIDVFDLYVVKQYYSKDKILAFCQFLCEFTQSQPVSWDPCLVGCLISHSAWSCHIDADVTLDWDRFDGRYTIIPIILRSDYNANPSLKPKGLG
jgi:hypothetical protein